MFLREIGRYPNHYSRIVITTKTWITDKDAGSVKFKDCDCDGMEFECDDIRKYDYIWNILASFIKWDVDSLTEDDEEICFFFHDDSEISKEKFVCVGCYKAEWEAENARCK